MGERVGRKALKRRNKVLEITCKHRRAVVKAK